MAKYDAKLLPPANGDMYEDRDYDGLYVFFLEGKTYLARMRSHREGMARTFHDPVTGDYLGFCGSHRDDCFFSLEDFQATQPKERKLMEFEIEGSGDVREVYHVTAENEEDARAKFERGECGEPALTEVTGSFILNVKEVQGC